MRSVLQDWVMELGLREQGTLLCAIRGCDLTPKYPLDSLERRLVGAIRYAILNAADPREIDSAPGCFMVSKPPYGQELKVSALGHYPQHWVAHLMHACEVLGYRHPDELERRTWNLIYRKFCHGYHVEPESPAMFESRMNEDRIANGTVVS